jgi:hypothetical protein
MSQAISRDADKASILAEAFSNAGRQIGFSQAELGEIIGKDRSAISRGRIDPDTKSGELALLFVRCYRALFVLVGGDPAQMRHWMRTPNHGTGGIPAEQVKHVPGLVEVLQYLDAIRGKL